MLSALTKRIRYLAAAFLAVFAGCFDYQEKIIFAPDFTGFVDIEYTVPVYSGTEQSMIQFLPASTEGLKEKYSLYLNAGGLELQDFSRKRIPPSVEDEFSMERMQVRYRLSFQDTQILERILIGKTDVFRRGGYLYINRKFPSSPPLNEETPIFTRNVHERLKQSFARRFLSFQIVFPWYYDLVTNYGSFARPGVHSFQLPLQSTFNAPSSFTWNIELKANRPPEGAL